MAAPAAQAQMFGTGTGGPFSGPYAGVQLGYTSGDADADGRFGDLRPSTSIDYDGWDIGAYGGYWMPFENFVLGTEIGASYVDADGSRNNFFGLTGIRGDVEKTREVYLSLKAGAAVQPELLIYAIGGAQIGRFEASWRDTGTGETLASRDKNASGWHLGAGAEYLFTPQWSARVEYKYQRYNEFTVTQPGVGSVDFEPSENVVRLGVSLNF